CPRAFGVVPPATSFRSAPEQKDLAVPPWMTITLTSGSVSKRSRAAPNAVAMSALTALCTCGRFRVSRPTAPRRSTSTGPAAGGVTELAVEDPPPAWQPAAAETETRTGEITLAASGVPSGVTYFLAPERTFPA